ncbi:cysteine-rich DPF motif domain-containing protein 1 isoform X3 [Rhinopithecus roxellana]|uniref:cysteine-rich DPF motif domain-containing protein 1 isoform X3 n=1 Tax=Rhinopithecus roxellana TaxID=61622 RepID=UPI0012376E4D|nr:cysteine-rich DPF motif domain-containing protein 1 isoform X3 [Rhinopithecus roxellana]
MASHAECRPLGMFECELCALTAPYSYVGQKPPNTQSMVLLEESYVMKDPFTSHKDRFLVLGSRCSLCSRLVCVGPVESRTGGLSWKRTPVVFSIVSIWVPCGCGSSHHCICIPGSRKR